jgi:DNA repair protein RadC
VKLKELFGKNKIKELNENELKLSDEKKLLKEIKFVKSKDLKFVATKSLKEKQQISRKHYEGHRSRLRERVLKDSEVLQDYELLEALLTFSIPRADVKPLAKELLDKFKTFSNVLGKSHSQIESVGGIGDATKYFFRVVNEACARMAREEINEDILLNNIEKVVCYCKLRMSHLEYEQFRVLFINRKNKLILDEVIQSGTIDKAAIFPRELVKRAIEVGAGAIILAHNHPSGDPTPSKADIETTLNIQKAASVMEIFLYDHVIIGRNGYYSMRANNFSA